MFERIGRRVDEVVRRCAGYDRSVRKRGHKKRAIGTIILSEIRSLTFDVVFSDKTGYDYAEREIFVGDMELVRGAGATDEEIPEDLPGHNPAWWCKVEDGYVLNLKGERKNKIPYDYDS